MEDYANDLHDFHFESKNKIIIPILLAPEAKQVLSTLKVDYQNIHPCIKTNTNNFSEIIFAVYQEFHSSKNIYIDPSKWEESEYQPTPSIIHAAKALFADQKVETITKSGAEGNDLKRTTEYLIKVINQARIENKKIVST